MYARSTMPSDELLFAPGLERWTLDCKLMPSPLPAVLDYKPTHAGGALAHLDNVSGVE